MSHQDTAFQVFQHEGLHETLNLSLSVASHIILVSQFSFHLLLPHGASCANLQSRNDTLLCARNSRFSLAIMDPPRRSLALPHDMDEYHEHTLRPDQC